MNQYQLFHHLQREYKDLYAIYGFDKEFVIVAIQGWIMQLHDTRELDFAWTGDGVRSVRLDEARIRHQ